MNSYDGKQPSTGRYEEVCNTMLATTKSFDAMLADAIRQTAKNNALAQDTARYYLDEISTANRLQIAAFETLQHTLIRSLVDIQNASSHLSRSLLDSTSSLNRALVDWAFTAIWPVRALGLLTDPAKPAHLPPSSRATSDTQTVRSEDFAASALQFQGPMGNIASGLAEDRD